MHTEVAFVLQGQTGMPLPAVLEPAVWPRRTFVTGFLSVCVHPKLFCLRLMTYKVNEAPCSPDGIGQT